MGGLMRAASGAVFRVDAHLVVGKITGSDGGGVWPARKIDVDGNFILAPPACDLRTLFTVGRKDTVKPSQIDPRFGHQRGESGDEV